MIQRVLASKGPVAYILACATGITLYFRWPFPENDNPFFSPVVRLQPECGHRVITAGPYRFMRHPGYFAMWISVPASALAIGSLVALIPAIGFVWVIHQRTRIEDQFLKANLPGYTQYSERVPAGLPFIRRA